MNVLNRMKLELQSNRGNEEIACTAVKAFAKDLKSDLTLQELEDIERAVSEAVNNCIVHAYPDGTGIITIKCRILANDTLDIVIKDKGVGIEDVDQAMKALFTTAGPKHGGVGFSIMIGLMTECNVKSVQGKGTTVHMKKIRWNVMRCNRTKNKRAVMLAYFDSILFASFTAALTAS